MTRFLQPGAGSRAATLRAAAIAFTGVLLYLLLPRSRTPMAWPRRKGLHSGDLGHAPAAFTPGAKHMVTGYDHLLFLARVIFFLYKLRTSRSTSACSRLDTRSRCCTGCTPGERQPYVIDAIIGLSVVQQGARQPSVPPALVRRAAEHQRPPPDLWPVPRLRPGGEDPGVRDRARWPIAQPAGVQRRRGDRPVARARRILIEWVLAPQRRFPPPRLHRQRRHDVRRVHADRLSALTGLFVSTNSWSYRPYVQHRPPKACRPAEHRQAAALDRRSRLP